MFFAFIEFCSRYNHFLPSFDRRLGIEKDGSWKLSHGKVSFLASVLLLYAAVMSGVRML
jgi:hypothetical protein